MSEWAPFAAFWLLLFALLAAEALLPIHREPNEPKGRLAANFGLGILNAALFSTLPLSTVIAAGWAREEGIGAMNMIALPAAAAFAATFALRSLAAYGLHVASHRAPLLWRMHRVHHADTAIDLSTGFRHHPLELIVVAAAHAGIAIALGLSVEALMVYEAAAVALTLWTHANLRLPARLERALTVLFVSPGFHHVHHSARREETDSNYGEVFSLWDRLFGTYRAKDAEALQAMRIGLGDGHDVDAPKLLRQLASPFRAGSSEEAAL